MRRLLCDLAAFLPGCGFVDCNTPTTSFRGTFGIYATIAVLGIGDHYVDNSSGPYSRLVLKIPERPVTLPLWNYGALTTYVHGRAVGD